MMAQTPAAAPHSSGTGDCDASRKRQRSPDATALGDMAPPTTPRLPMQATDASAAAGGVTTDGPSTRWQAARQRFAAARWRRGCFHLPLFPAPPPTLAPRPPPQPAQSSGKDACTSRTHAPPSAGVLGACDPAQRPPAQGRGSGNSEGAGVITADCDPIALTACYLPPNPWKALRGMDCRSVAVQAHGPQSPAFLAPPVMVRLERWNAYWAAYSACCADELEGLATQLRVADEAASPAATAYRCVDVTLTASMWSPLPSASACEFGVLEDGAWDAVAPFGKRAALGALTSPALQRSPSAESIGSSASSTSYSYASSYTTASSSYDASYSASTRSVSRSSCESELPASASDLDARAAWVAPVAPHVLADLLYHAAHHFGAIEHFSATMPSDIEAGALMSHQQLLRVQFTTATAAGLYWRWIDGLAAVDVVEGYRREWMPASAGEMSSTADSPRPSTPKAKVPRDDVAEWWDSVALAMRQRSMRLEASLVPHDPCHATSELLLGPNVLVSTPLVRSLFEGLFAETKLEYRPALRGFRVRFASRDECRLAVHALQCSLWRVFNVSLIFT